MDIQVGTLFLDREFYHAVPISTAYQLNTKFVMAAKSNQ
jgi:hypothetical protein